MERAGMSVLLDGAAKKSNDAAGPRLRLVVLDLRLAVLA